MHTSQQIHGTTCACLHTCISGHSMGMHEPAPPIKDCLPAFLPHFLLLFPSKRAAFAHANVRTKVLQCHWHFKAIGTPSKPLALQGHWQLHQCHADVGNFSSPLSASRHWHSINFMLILRSMATSPVHPQLQLPSKHVHQTSVWALLMAILFQVLLPGPVQGPQASVVKSISINVSTGAEPFSV